MFLSLSIILLAIVGGELGDFQLCEIAAGMLLLSR